MLLGIMQAPVSGFARAHWQPWPRSKPVAQKPRPKAAA